MLALLVLKMALKHTGSKDTRNKSEIMTGRKTSPSSPFSALITGLLWIHSRRNQEGESRGDERGGGVRKEGQKGRGGKESRRPTFSSTARSAEKPCRRLETGEGEIKLKAAPPPLRTPPLSHPHLPVLRLVSAADQILTILALIRSGGRYPLRFRRHIRVLSPRLLSTGEVRCKEFF